MLSLKQTTVFWPKNIYELIKNSNDKQFLFFMQTDRLATLGSADRMLAKKESRLQVKKEAEQKGRDREKERCSAPQELHLKGDSENEMCEKSINVPVLDKQLQTSKSEKPYSSFEDNRDGQLNNCAAREHKRLKKTGQTLFVPHNALTKPEIQFTSIRNEITSPAQSAVVKSIVKSIGGDLNQFSVSYTLVSRYLTPLIKNFADDIKQSWTSPKVGNLHWDSKLMQSLQNKHKEVERLPVLVSGSNSIKLLLVSGSDCIKLVYGSIFSLFCWYKA